MIHGRLTLASMLLAALVGLSGCGSASSEDNDRFAAEINRTISVNMPLSTATERLGQSGFSCASLASSPEITCTRKRDALLNSCTQHVTLMADSGRDRVAGVKPAPVACVGGF